MSSAISTADGVNPGKHSAFFVEEGQPAKAKQRRRTLSRSLSHLRQSNRIEHDDSDGSRPSWLDAYEETLDERFVFTLKDDPEQQQKNSKKKGKRSAILSPRSLDKENLSASHQNETPSGESGELLTKPRRKHSRSLLLRSKRLRDDGPTSAECLTSTPVEVVSVAFAAPCPLPFLPSGPEGPLPPPPPDADSPPRVHQIGLDAAAPPPPLPPRDYDSDYALDGAMRGRSRTYAHPAELRKAGFSSASCASISAFTPRPLIPPEAIPHRPPTGVQGTRSMYELSSTPQMHGLAQSQPVQLNRSYQLERHASGAKDLKRWEKKETKERKKLEKLAKKERKKEEKQQRKEAKRAGGKPNTETTHSAYFVDLSPPSFDETRARRLL